ncbi:MAG: FAD-dependent oxidoreductase, partial [Chloroflexota bacterium]
AKKIVVLEKRDRPGGVSALAGGLFAAESPVQVRRWVDADRDRLFRKALDWAHWSQVDPRVLRAFIDRSGDTIRWLEDKGLEFDLISFYPDQDPPVQHNPRGHGAKLVQVLAQQCRERGVELLLNTPVIKITRSKQGRATGVLAEKDGGIIEIRSRNVIIATGGFCGNKELFSRYFPSAYASMTLSGLPLTGDGIIMAGEIGAAIEGFATVIKEGPRYDIHTWPLMALERDPTTIWVNKKGERFTDEATGYHVFESVNAMLRQPDQACFTLLDAGIRRHFEEKGLKLSRITPASATKTPSLEKALQAGAAWDRIKIAGSWDDIAQRAGIDPQVLKETVERYNAFCDRGYDADFAKERKYLLPLRTPPYYAIRDLAVLLDTVGGIRINERMEVLDRQDNPIPGLYAAGVTTSGWEPENYCGELNASAFGFAVTSGRIAGENTVRASLR